MNLNEVFELTLKMPIAIRNEVYEFFNITPGNEELVAGDIICTEGSRITKKDFYIKKIIQEDIFLSSNIYKGGIDTFISHCVLKKNSNVKVLLIELPSWVNNAMFQHMAQVLCFYHRKYQKAILKLTKTYDPVKLNGDTFSSAHYQPYDYLDNIQDYVREEEHYKKLYTNTVGFLLNPPKELKIIKRGIGLHGKQGTGKTAIIKDILKQCKDNKIYSCIVEPGDISMSSKFSDQLFDFIKNRKPSVIVFEDFDSLVLEREENMQIESSVLKNLLNFLDGFYVRDRNVVIFSTNHIDRIDKALKRPGRIDTFIEFKYPTEEDKITYFTRRNVSKELLDKYMTFSKDFTWAMLFELVNRRYFEKDRALSEIAKDIISERQLAERKMGFEAQ